jgi:hypothetical protein
VLVARQIPADHARSIAAPSTGVKRRTAAPSGPVAGARAAGLDVKPDIEAPTTNKRYTLGQLFDEWQIKLSATGIGGLKNDGKNTLTAYISGKKQTGDPASIELTAHREIALVYGPAGAKVNVPASYKFPQGE